MLLNLVEFGLMNNPVRAFIQRHFEAMRLLRMGGSARGGRALEVGCGRGIGVQIVLDKFHAASVDAFDLDPRMVLRARRRIPAAAPVRLWVGDCTSIPVNNAVYDAVFDFGIIHHIPDWRAALAEISRVLKPGGKFYGEEALATFITHPVARLLLYHPQTDRFGLDEVQQAMPEFGLLPKLSESLGKSFGWFIAVKTPP